jgi:hypothetical protein
MKKKLTEQQQQQLDALRYSVKRAEEKGNTDTAHHEILQRLEAELGLIPDKKDTREFKDEVTNG